MATANVDFMANIMGSPGLGKAMGLLLAVAAFPPACFSSFIAANSFKTTLPKVNPFISVGIGTAVSILLAVTGWAGDVIGVFTIIGAAFGPVCGAMMVDYLMAGKKWAGPRAGWNLAGWISWVAGFIVGMAPLVGLANVPAAPLMAFIVGAVLYYVLAKAGLESKVLEMAAAPAESAPQKAPPAEDSKGE
jgi:cytosine permease